MFSLTDNTIGDTWYIVSNNIAHCFFCTSPEPDPDWNWDIGHAVSKDLVNWDYIGLSVTRGADGHWDSQTLSTGSVIERQGRYWMAYSALLKGENPPTRKIHRVGMAVSDDLCKWEKLPNNPVNQRDPRYYERLGPVHKAYSQWRDPFLYDHNGTVYQFVCARSKNSNYSRRGTIGTAVSNNMTDWRVLPPIDAEPIATEIEVPQVYEVDGKYYLVFCTTPARLQPFFTGRFPDHQFRRADYSMVGDSPLGPFNINGTGEIIGNDSNYNLYASRIVKWQSGLFLLGTSRQDGISSISDPIPVSADKFGIHTST